MKTYDFFVFMLELPVALFFIACEIGDKIIMGNRCKLQSIVVLRHNWNLIWNIKAVDSILVIENEYLYELVTYSNGSRLYHRN